MPMDSSGHRERQEETMGQVFEGDLLLPGDEAGLLASLEVGPVDVVLSAGDESLGSWPRQDYAVETRDAGVFRLSFGEEEALFKPASPAEFATAMAIPLQPARPAEPSRRRARAETKAAKKRAKAEARARQEPDDGLEDLIAQVRPIKDLTSDDEFISPALMRAIVVLAAIVVTAGVVAIAMI